MALQTAPVHLAFSHGEVAPPHQVDAQGEVNEGTFSVSMGSAEEAGGVLAMLATDCILAFTAALDTLADQVLPR